MTSKEAFEKMVEACNQYHHTMVNTDIKTICGYPIDKIKQDLEVLEIIKKHKYLIYVICAKMYGLTQEEINKIKECFE